MTDIDTLKEALPALAAVVSAVSAYWIARRAATSEVYEVEKQVAEVNRAIAVLKATTVTDRDVRAIVASSLDVLESILTTIETDSKSNSIELRQLLIEIAMVKTRLEHVEKK